MITCQQLAEKANEYLEGELTLWDKLGFWLHMGLCAACRAFVDQVRRTRDLVRAVASQAEDATPEPPDSLLANLRDGAAGR